MKTVLLLRHAKSSWDQPHLPDSLRPLDPRGRRAAPRMGDYMSRNGLIPNRVLCSPARRAVETWELISTYLGDSVRFEITQDLYDASPGGLLAILQHLPHEEDTVLLVGHNPTFEELASALAGGGRTESMAELARKYPTGALAVIDFSVVGWPDVREGAGFLRDFIRPRGLKP
ncbi:MAG: histidine phosphatase family protein [Longimicrobiales bacterium]|nr:histidine phosphatase family protein [Longimicrobiales bacterium]